MLKPRFFPLISLLLSLAFILVGCSAANAPKQIASYPAHPTILPPPPHTVLVYNAYLELEVSDTSEAAGKASRLAYDHGGYLDNSYSWYQDGRQHITLELAVPRVYFDDTLRGLKRLGYVASENISGDLKQTRYNDPPQDEDGKEHRLNTFSHITVVLRPWSLTWQSGAPEGWRPLRTLERAIRVFGTIFGFLIDILIWVVIVVGPFALIGWLISAVFRRRRAHP